MSEIETAAIRALAAIDKAIGIPADGCNSTERTLEAIGLMHLVNRDLNNSVELACVLLMNFMKMHERRIRSETTAAQHEKRPWECAEYLAAAEYLRKTWERKTDEYDNGLPYDARDWWQPVDTLKDETRLVRLRDAKGNEWISSLDGWSKEGRWPPVDWMRV